MKTYTCCCTLGVEYINVLKTNNFVIVRNLNRFGNVNAILRGKNYIIKKAVSLMIIHKGDIVYMPCSFMISFDDVGFASHHVTYIHKSYLVRKSFQSFAAEHRQLRPLIQNKCTHFFNYLNINNYQ